MADTKISDLTALADGALATNDLLVVVDTSAVQTKKYPVSGLDGRFIGETDVAAKGDLFVATANDAVAVLSVGANDTVLTADSATATGVKWATPAAAPVTSVNAATGVVVLDADDIDDTSTTHKFATSAQLTKIDSVETNADVTDAANVSAAGAPIITEGSGAPAITPAKAGDIYIDTTADDAYIAVGAASSADWEISNDGAGSGSTNLSWVAATSTVASSTGTDATLTAVDGSNPGLMSVADKSKLDGIETGATADQSAVDVSIVDTGALYTATNVEAALAEVKAIADSAAGGGVTTVGTPVTNDFARFTGASTIEGRSYSEVRTDLGLVIGTNVQAHSAVLDATTASFTTADETKLDGIEALADVTDATNVTAAGALMDSEVTNLAAIQAFDPDDYATAAQGDTADGALQKVAAGASVENVGAIEENVEVANVTGTKAMDLATYGRAVFTMTGDTTFSVTNPAPSGKASTFVMRVKGAHTPTLPASWDFIGTPPAYVGAGEGTSYVGTSEDGGTTYQVTVLAGWA